MNDEQRKAVRMALSGQDSEPVALKTTADGAGWMGGPPDYKNGAEYIVDEDELIEEEEVVHEHPNNNGELNLSTDDVLRVIQQLYPVHFNHAVAEVKAQVLAQRLKELT